MTADRILSDEVKAKMRLAAKLRMLKRPPWNKGLKIVVTPRVNQKLCGIRYRARLDTTPMPVVFRGMNTAPRA